MVGSHSPTEKNNELTTGHFMIMSDFAEVGGDLTAADGAGRNNQREDRDLSTKLRAPVDREPE